MVHGVASRSILLAKALLPHSRATVHLSEHQHVCALLGQCVAEVQGLTEGE